MKMTIDNAISELELLKKNTFSYMSAHQAFITAIDTMRKYQKIEQIISEWNNHCISTQVAISEIANEVIEDGNEL